MNWKSLGETAYNEGVRAIELAKSIAGEIVLDSSSPICWTIEDYRETLYDLKYAMSENRDGDAMKYIEEALQLYGELLRYLLEY